MKKHIGLLSLALLAGCGVEGEAVIIVLIKIMKRYLLIRRIVAICLKCLAPIT